MHNQHGGKHRPGCCRTWCSAKEGCGGIRLLLPWRMDQGRLGEVELGLCCCWCCRGVFLERRLLWRKKRIKLLLGLDWIS